LAEGKKVRGKCSATIRVIGDQITKQNPRHVCAVTVVSVLVDLTAAQRHEIAELAAVTGPARMMAADISNKIISDANRDYSDGWKGLTASQATALVNNLRKDVSRSMEASHYFLHSGIVSSSARLLPLWSALC
jgi:hypothetical protein